ncbi:DUF58 domain-containing protein [Nocardiopsis sp. EMB25]|uniref:DUF58 domain-containing protein n=1 Tax=Nocardiopsis sp. EMB25 TaxID=2835867 RepID=UPI002283683B|nr:DUF58 domain-containing protein [Nocardiopsis sp. EMB25]MCY9782900.1 DUF58 domain-containing protein [Nocardiopsis sp. EMB25]
MTGQSTPPEPSRTRRTLTVRGGLVLFFGVLALVAGLVTRQREAVGLGVLLIAVPSVASLVLVGAAARIVNGRTLVPNRVPAGHEARVLVRIGNASSVWPVTSVFVQDGLPVPLGTHPRFTIGYLGARAVRDVSYLVRPAVRGSYAIGPLMVGMTDPLGCVRVTRVVGSPSHLLVTPSTVPLSPLGAVDGSQGEESPRRSVTGVGEQDPVPREYRYGDELRRVHWRSTAKHGELMVRRDEQHRREHSAVLLDTRLRAHLGEGPAGSLETAVSAAASVAVHLIDNGHELRLYTERGRVPTAVSSEALDSLAVTAPSDVPGLLGGFDMLGAQRGGSPSLVVAVLGAMDPEEVAALSAIRGGTRLAVLCARAAWSSADALNGAGELLASAGWRVLTVSTPRELPPLWRRASAPAPAAGPTTPLEGPR